jgi:hypothetical protein
MFDERLRGISGLVLGETEARRYGRRGVGNPVGYLRPEPLCQQASFANVGLGCEDDELFPAPAAEPVGCTQYGSYGPHDLA